MKILLRSVKLVSAILYILLFNTNGHAEEFSTDSILNVISTTKYDSTKVQSLIFLGEIIYSDQPDSAFNTFLHAKRIAEKNLAHYKKFKDAESVLAAYRFSKSLADAYYDLGYLSLWKGDVPNGLEYYHKSLEFRENARPPKGISPDRHGIAQTLNDIGVIYHKQENYQEALKYYNRSLAIRKELGDKPGTSQSLNNIGVTYKNQNAVLNALENYKQALAIQEGTNDKEGLGYTLNNIAAIYKDFGDPECKNSKEVCEAAGCEKAIVYLERSIRIQEEANDKAGLAFSRNNLASVQLKLKKYNEALLNANQSLDLARELGYPDIISRASQTLSKLYEQKGDYKNAFTMHVLYKQMADSINNENNRKSSIKRDFQYVYEKKVAADSIRSLEERKVFDARIKQEKTQRSALYIVISVIAIFSAFLYNRFRVTRKQKNIITQQKTEVEHQNRIIEEKNKDITDSINYAKRIQQAKLPHVKDVKSSLPDSFILYKPKDIVSGDFYFFHQDEERSFLAAADCTGHGVPGALMSMICSEKLNDAVRQFNEPSAILRSVNRSLKLSLRQFGDEGSTRDGMDIALVSIDKSTNSLIYSGANRPLWIIRKGGNELEEIKATKAAIGGHTPDEQEFKDHKVQIDPGDSFYISTDGYADSFNEAGKKLTTKKFKQLLVEQSCKTMKEQELFLSEFIDTYTKGQEQVDDILVIGFTFNS